jgi:hypothetical protein
MHSSSSSSPSSPSPLSYSSSLAALDLSGFQKTIDEQFPGAMLIEKFVVESMALLHEHGFHRHNSIPLVSVCRDELTRPFVERIDELWSHSFDISSLAGMVFCGKTGFMAAMHHAPVADGKERYVFYVGPHIAVDDKGEIGKVWRSGREKCSSACGALVAFLAEIVEGRLNVQLDVDDIEQSLLKQKLMSYIRYGEKPSLESLTYCASDCVTDTVERLLKVTVNPEHCDYAIFSGIQIHGPMGTNYFMPRVMYVMKDGKQIQLKERLGHVDATYISQSEQEKRYASLCFAASSGNLPRVRHYLETGVSIEGTDYDKRSALHLAASEGHLDIVKLLLRKGASLNASDRWKNNPLESSVLHRQWECAAFLHNAGATLRDNFIGHRIVATAAKGDLETLKVLVEYAQHPETAVNFADYDGRTALHLAACEGHSEVVSYLISKKADTKAKDRFGHTPLDGARFYKKEDSAKLLEEA